MMTYQQALEATVQGVHRLPTESVPLLQARGRVLATTLTAPYDMPPYDQSMVDGYALRSRDTRQATPQHPARLPLGATLTAGETPQQALHHQQAIRIMTGAPLPGRADAVIKMEDSQPVADALLVPHPLERGVNLQRRGAEIKRATVVLRAGDLLTPQRIGVALGLGVHTVEVVRRPSVACVAPGNELLPPGTRLQPGKKWCSNLYAMELRLEELGCSSRNLGIVPDTLESLVESLQRGLTSDIMVILGASGRGDHDFAAQAIKRLGADVLFRGVATAPGRSTTVARCQQTLICALPGSPWAAFVGFEVFVWPIIRVLLGIQPVLPPTQPAVLTEAVHFRPGVTHFFPAHLRPHTEGWQATPLDNLLALARCEPHALGLITVPARRRHLVAGARVRVQSLSSAVYGS